MLSAIDPFTVKVTQYLRGQVFRISKGQKVGLRKVFVKFDMKESSKLDKNFRVS